MRPVIYCFADVLWFVRLDVNGSPDDARDGTRAQTILSGGTPWTEPDTMVVEFARRPTDIEGLVVCGGT